MGEGLLVGVSVTRRQLYHQEDPLKPSIPRAVWATCRQLQRKSSFSSSSSLHSRKDRLCDSSWSNQPLLYPGNALIRNSCAHSSWISLLLHLRDVQTGSLGDLISSLGVQREVTHFSPSEDKRACPICRLLTAWDKQSLGTVVDSSWRWMVAIIGSICVASGWLSPPNSRPPENPE